MFLLIFHLLEWHPFSISSGPDEETLEIHIRGLGDHTQKLMERVSQDPKNSKLWIRIDGPYGNLRVSIRRFPNVVLVLGGIGFSPIIGILKDLDRTGKLDPRMEQNPPHLMQNVHVLWVGRSAGQSTWFNEEIEQFVKASGNNLPFFHASIYISGAKSEDPAFQSLTNIKTEKAEVNHFSGRPNFDEHCSQAIIQSQANMVFVCG